MSRDITVQEKRDFPELAPAAASVRRVARRLCVAFLLGSPLLGAAAHPVGATPVQEPVYPGKSWTKTAPEELGWSSQKLARARAYAETVGSAAVMVVHQGVVIADWGETARKFNVHSIRKSLLSSLYGVYVKRGAIQLEKTVAELGIDDNNPLAPQEKQARVIDLLRARSGVYHPALYESQAMAYARPPRGSHPPNTFWYYNNWDFNTLGTIFRQETGQGIHETFEREIARPLEMEDFRAEDGSLVTGEASRQAAYPFRMTARDMARFGLLYLRKGWWRGKPIVPEEWIAASTRTGQAYGEFGGYGYMWWVAVEGKQFPGANVGKGAFAAWGAGQEYLSNHIIAVLPEHDLVFVHRVNTDEPGHVVSSAQIGHILKLILDAKGR